MEAERKRMEGGNDTEGKRGREHIETIEGEYRTRQAELEKQRKTT